MNADHLYDQLAIAGHCVRVVDGRLRVSGVETLGDGDKAAIQANARGLAIVAVKREQQAVALGEYLAGLSVADDVPERIVAVEVFGRWKCLAAERLELFERHCREHEELCRSVREKEQQEEEAKVERRDETVEKRRSQKAVSAETGGLFA